MKWMRHVTHMNESCHTYVWIVSHIWMNHVTYIWMNHVTHINESSHTREWIMSCIWMSLGPDMNEPCLTYEWVISLFPCFQTPRSICKCQKYIDIRPSPGICYSKLQYTATHCSTLQHTIAYCSCWIIMAKSLLCVDCSTLHQTAIRYTTLQDTASLIWNLRQVSTAAHYSTLQNNHKCLTYTQKRSTRNQKSPSTHRKEPYICIHFRIWTLEVCIYTYIYVYICIHMYIYTYA